MRDENEREKKKEETDKVFEIINRMFIILGKNCWEPLNLKLNWWMKSKCCNKMSLRKVIELNWWDIVYFMVQTQLNWEKKTTKISNILFNLNTKCFWTCCISYATCDLHNFIHSWTKINVWLVLKKGEISIFLYQFEILCYLHFAFVEPNQFERTTGHGHWLIDVL